MKTKLNLIDFSSLYFSVCYNVSLTEHTDNFAKYKETLDFYVNSILEDTETTNFICFGDGYSSFRKKEFSTFKDDRTAKVKMKFIKELKDYAEEKYKIITSNYFEADDLILIYHNYYKDKYDIIISSKDSDLRQYPALFYNYGYRRSIYKKSIGKPSEIDLKEGLERAFEDVSPKMADFNLWKNVLIKGHNNKSHHLDRCGEETAHNYLLVKDQSEYPNAVLTAFIEGIDKNKYPIKSTVKGYGLYKGIDYFEKSFKQTYLLRNLEESKLIYGDFEIEDIILNKEVM